MLDSESMAELAKLREQLEHEIDERFDSQDEIIDNLSQSMKTFQDTMKIVGEIGGKALIGWGTNKDDTSLADALSETLKKLKRNGVMGKLQTKYFGYVMDDLPEKDFIPSG